MLFTWTDSFSDRANAESAFPTTNGARDMLSTPPAITSSASPLLMKRAAFCLVGDVLTTRVDDEH